MESIILYQRYLLYVQILLGHLGQLNKNLLEFWFYGHLVLNLDSIYVSYGHFRQKEHITLKN